jgi:hypothetical protein
MAHSFLIRATFAIWLLLFGGAAADEPVSRNIGVFGDSLGDGVWGGLYGITKSHPETKLFHYSKIGAGLSRPDYAAWFKDFGATLDQDHITDAVIIFGINDQDSIRDENRKGYAFASDGWRTLYTARVDAVLGEFAKRKVRTVWVGLPVMRRDDFNAADAMLNTIYEAESNRLGATFLPLIETFKGPDGAFATHLPDGAGRLHLVRADDGVHFTPYGYEMIAAKVYALITADRTETADAQSPAQTVTQ